MKRQKAEKREEEDGVNEERGRSVTTEERKRTNRREKEKIRSRKRKEEMEKDNTRGGKGQERGRG